MQELLEALIIKVLLRLNDLVCSHRPAFSVWSFFSFFSTVKNRTLTEGKNTNQGSCYTFVFNLKINRVFYLPTDTPHHSFDLDC